MKEGELAGANIARSVLGARIRQFSFRGLGQAAGLGNGSGISELYGMTFRGRLAWIIRVFYFAWFMPRRSDGVTALRLLFADWAREGFEAAKSEFRPTPRGQRVVTATDRSRER
ncbi:MAG: hypothetical protein ABIP44_12800, partial [Pseudoxanthomonas sp.]